MNDLRRNTQWLPLVFVFLASGLASVTAAEERTRPNILWIICEDSSPKLGCYGEPHAITPTLDALAASGVRYTNAWAVSPVCSVSRSAIVLGMYPTSVGTHHHRSFIENNRTVTSAIRLPAQVRCFTELLREAGYYCSNNDKTDYNFPTPKAAWDDSSRRAHWRQRPNQTLPFFSVFNFVTTHEGRLVNERAYLESVRELAADKFHDPAKITLPPYYPDTPAIRKVWAHYFDVITVLDGQVRAVLDQLEADGLAENTIVFFFSDHGVGLPRGKRLLYDSGLRVPLIVRIPEKFRVNGHPRPGDADHELVSLIDLAPTVLRLAGIAAPAYMHGRPFLDGSSPAREYLYATRDRMEERYDVVRALRDKRYKYIRNYEPWKPYLQTSMTPESGPLAHELRRLAAENAVPPLTRPLMAPTKPREELYDLVVDPHELQNLATSAEHQKILSRLRGAHRRWLIDTGDLGFLPEPLYHEIQDTQPLSVSEAIAKRTTLAPARLMELAVAWEAGGTAEPKLMQAMEDQEPAVRYWAATGLGHLARETRHVDVSLRRALRDSSPAVRLAAARALANVESYPVLLAALRSESPWTRLMSINAIGALPKPPADLLAQLQECRQDSNWYVSRLANIVLQQFGVMTASAPAPANK